MKRHAVVRLPNWLPLLFVHNTPYFINHTTSQTNPHRIMLCAIVSSVFSALLTETPMLMAHDSATGYLKENIIDKEVYDWTITQKGRFDEQLTCGARALDIRLEVKEGKLKLHHGVVPVPTKPEVAFKDVLTWAANSSNTGELALLDVTHCDGDSCTDLAEVLFTSLNITILNCSDLPTTTFERAVSLGKQGSGGSILAVPHGCHASNYEPTVTCYPPYKYKVSEGDVVRPAKRGVGLAVGCHVGSSHEDTAFDLMYLYLNRTSAKPLQKDTFVQLQALWQEGADTIPIGVVTDSSLVKDELKSKINAHLAEKLALGWFPNINFLEVNNACDGGMVLKEALGRRV